MEVFNIKKFIAIFILAASLTSSVTIIIQILSATPPSLQLEAQNQPERPSPAYSGSAFVETLASTTTNAHLGGEGSSKLSAPSPGNLTESASWLLAQGVIGKNPDGATLDALGNQSFQAPNVDDLISQFTNDPKVAAGVAGESITTSISKDEVGRIIDSSSPEDYVAYFAAYEKTFNSYVNNSNLTRLINNLSPEALNTAGVAIRSVKGELGRFAIPRLLLPLHLATLRLLNTWQEVTALDPRDTNDPLKSLVTLNLRVDALQKLSSALGEEFKRLDFKKISYAPSRDTFSVLEFLGVKNAHAFWGYVAADAVQTAADTGANAAGSLSVPTTNFVQNIQKGINDAAQTGKDFWDQLLGWILATLKDRLIHVMVQQTINWIQGGGTPRFVSDWQGFLEDAASQGVGDWLRENAPRLCSSFGPLVHIISLPVNPHDTRPVTCTLSQVVSNAEAFYGDFQNGGWVAYQATIQPQNNFFGALYLTNLFASEEAIKREQAAQNDARASQGFLSDKICLQYADRCDRIGGCDGHPEDIHSHCLNYGNTTPGAVVSNLTYKALGTTFDRLVNAQDWNALINAAVNAIIQRLVRAGQNGLLGIVTTDSSCRGLTGIDYDQCEVRKACTDAGLSGDELQACLGVRPQAPTAPPPTPTSTPPLHCGPNPPPGCTCVGDPGGPTPNMFLFTGKVSQAQDAIKSQAQSECTAGGTNTVGLDCADLSHVLDGVKYVPAVANKVASVDSSLLGKTDTPPGDEVDVKGPPPPQYRQENFDILTSQNKSWIHEVAICIPPQSPPF